MSPPRGLVLMYHRIGTPLLPEEGDYITEAEQFEEHVQVFASTGRPVLPLEALQASAIPDGALWLTFDDGRESDVVLAAPRLREAGYPAAFFVNPLLVGDRTRGNASWPQLRALADGGFVIGSHGLDHQLFDGLADTELEQQIVDSKRRLEDGLGRPVRALALPGGSGGERARLMAEAAGYEIVLGSQPGRVTATGRRGIVPRFAMREWHSPGRLRALLAGGTLLWLSYALRYQATHRARHVLGERSYGRLRMMFLALREGRIARAAPPAASRSGPPL